MTDENELICDQADCADYPAETCLATRMGFSCTRAANHDGEHHAHGNDGELYAVWEDGHAGSN